MELVNADAESVTIRLRQKQEYAALFDILRTFSTELEGNNIDLELLMLSRQQAERFLKDFFELDQELYESCQRPLQQG
jgi:hypothetical protein